MAQEPWGSAGGVVLVYQNHPRGGRYVRWTADGGRRGGCVNIYRQRTADTGYHWMTEESHSIPVDCMPGLIEYLEKVGRER